jgi:hypothetical protein
MIYYRVALQASHCPAWQWRSTILTSLEAVLRLLRIYSNLLSNDRIRVFFASSAHTLDEMLTRQNQGAVSNSMSVEQLIVQNWRISPLEIRRVEAELGFQENKGSGPTTVLAEQLMNGQPSHIPDMTQVDADQGADHDLPYIFTLPTFMPEALSWARLLAKVQAGEVVSGELVP